MPTVRIATRKSPLALWQAEHVKALLLAREPGLAVALVKLSTKGDKILDSPLAKIGGKGLFVKEIEDALLDGRADLAVHSLKDVPAEVPAGLVLASHPPREDPRDAFVSSRHARLAEVPNGARLGTASLRRACQIKAERPDIDIVSIRGNVQTRIRRIRDELDGGVLAYAGLKRLGLADQAAEVIEPEAMLPAVGQGVLAIETRAADAAMRGRAEALGDRDAVDAVTAERAFLARIGGGCQVPLAAHATLEGDRMTVRALVGWPDGHEVLRAQRQGSRRDAARMGLDLAEELLGRGADRILASLQPDGQGA